MQRTGVVRESSRRQGCERVLQRQWDEWDRASLRVGKLAGVSRRRCVSELVVGGGDEGQGRCVCEAGFEQGARETVLAVELLAG